MVPAIRRRRHAMVRTIRKNHTGAFKAKVALEAVKGEKTLAQLSSEFGVHANQMDQWRKQLLKELPTLFANRHSKHDPGNCWAQPNL